MELDFVITAVYVGKHLWDRFIILCDGVSWNSLTGDSIKEETVEKNFSCGDTLTAQSDKLSYFNKFALSKNGKEEHLLQHTAFKVSVKMNGHVLSYFVKLLKLLSTYRKYVLNQLNHRKRNLKKSYGEHSLILLKIHLVDVDQQIIDIIWNKHISYLVAEECELGHAMSWLSTLGGAFSALGDYYTRCAEIAGHISRQQWRIALRLGDPNTVARCRLFSALSLMQTGHLKAAKQIVWKQYHSIKSGEYGQEPDIRLLRMCQGVWAKLRYEYQQRSQRKRTPKAFHWKRDFSI